MKVLPISARTRTLLTRMVSFILVMFIGAFLFMVIEGRHQKDRAASVLTIEKIKQNFVSLYNVSESDFEMLVDVIRNDTRDFHADHRSIPWNFGNSLYFSVFLVTTIGYGHIAPKTWQGQLFCIFYSLFGIPITALMLKSVGGYINLGVNHVISFVEKRLLKREPEHLETKCFITTLVLMVLMLMIGALITTFSEGWTMMQGVYFTFVTLSTIGFGDYIINDGKLLAEQPTRTAITCFGLVFLILGLGVVSSVLCSISTLLETGGLSCCKRRQRNDENEEMEIEQMVENVELPTEKPSNTVDKRCVDHDKDLAVL